VADTRKEQFLLLLTLFINLDGTSRAQMLNMHFQYMKVANVRVRYVATESKGDPVLLIHGLGGSIESWLNNVEAISSHNLQVIALDLPGFGLSDKPKNNVQYRILLKVYIKIYQAIEVRFSFFVYHW